MNEPTPEQVDLSVAQRRRRDRRVWRRGLLASALLHLAIFLLWRHAPVPVSSLAAAGPKAGDNRAAAGSLQAMNVRVPPSTPIVPPPIPIPTMAQVDPVEYEEQVEFDPAAVMGDAPGLDAPGTETGTGQGDGGTADEGLNRLSPPSPRSMIMPPDDDAMKGRSVEVWVFVLENGRVAPDSTVLRPPTSDGDLNRTLIEDASEWLFHPAQKDGEAVAAWWNFTLSVGGG